MTGLNVEDIGEVATKGYLELKADRLHAVVGDVEIFVQTTADRSADGEAKGARKDRAVFGWDGPVGQKDTCGVVVDGASVEQLPRLPIGVNRPIADDAGIKKVEALLARPGNLSIRLRDKHGLPLVDGNLGWANVNLERHTVLLVTALSTAAQSTSYATIALSLDHRPVRWQPKARLADAPQHRDLDLRGLFCARRLGLRHPQPDDNNRAQCYAGNAEKAHRAAKMSDDDPRKCGAERRANAGERADEALGQVESAGALRNVGDDQRREHPQSSAADTVEQLNASEQHRIAGHSE